MFPARILPSSLAGAALALALAGCSDSEAASKTRDEILDDVKSAAEEIKAGAETVAEGTRILVAKLGAELAEKKEQLKAAKEKLSRMTLAELGTAAGDKINATIERLRTEIIDLAAKVEAKIKGTGDNNSPR